MDRSGMPACVDPTHPAGLEAMRPSTIGRVAIRPALSALLVALAMTLPAHADDDPAAGYRLDDDRATVRLLATIPGESVAQVPRPGPGG
jgi:hypothetical protein